mgnify:FL=1
MVEDPSREQHFPLPLRLMQFPLIRQGSIPMAKTILPGLLPEKTRPMSSVETVVMKTGSTLPDKVPVPVYLIDRWEHASSCALKIASMWQHAHQALAKAVVALDGSDGSNARDDVNIILRGMSGLLKRLTVFSADSYLIPTLLKRDMVLDKSALPEATKKQLRLGALSDSVLGPVAQTAATGERKRRQEDGIVRLCQTQYKAFSQSKAPPVRKRTSESAGRAKSSFKRQRRDGFTPQQTQQTQQPAPTQTVAPRRGAATRGRSRGRGKSRGGYH